MIYQNLDFCWFFYFYLAFQNLLCKKNRIRNFLKDEMVLAFFKLEEAKTIESSVSVGFYGYVKFCLLGLSESKVVKPWEQGVGDLGPIDVLVDVVGLDGEVSPVVKTVSLEDERVCAGSWDVYCLGEN